MNLQEIISKLRADSVSENKIIRRDFDFSVHSQIVGTIAGKTFNFDNANSDFFKLLLYYFNGSNEFESFFPEKKYSLRKGLLLIGPVGTGKTSAMRIYQKYCAATELKHHRFILEDVRTIAKHFGRHGNTDKFAYNYVTKNNIEQKYISNICLDDLGTEVKSVKYFGTEEDPISDLILDRYNIFIKHRKKTHFTSNLDTNALQERYGERIHDRLSEMVNIIPIIGTSRRK